MLALLIGLDAALHTRQSDQRWVIEQDAEGHAAALRAGYLGVRHGIGGTVIYQRQSDCVRAGNDISFGHSPLAASRKGIA